MNNVLNLAQQVKECLKSTVHESLTAPHLTDHWAGCFRDKALQTSFALLSTTEITTRNNWEHTTTTQRQNKQTCPS